MAEHGRARGWSFGASVQRGWQRLTTTTTTPTTGPYSDSPPASPTLPASGSRRRPQSIGALSSPSGQQIPPQPTSSSSSFVNRLPPELWITIFELASSSSFSFSVDPLDITADHPWDTRTYPLQHLLSSYLATKDTLRSLCLISRTLYAPALSLLMRHVWLHRRAHARRLARTLSSRPTLGGLIRRIDVEIAGDSIQVSALDVRDILAHCGTGGLVCFTDRRGTYTNVGRWDAQYEAMLPALVAGGGGGTLRSVKVVQYAPATYGRRHWSALVEGFAGRAAALYELGIDLSLSTGTGAGAGVGGHLVFPTLRVLEVTLGPDDALSTIASWDIRRLHTFRLLGTTVTAETTSLSSLDRVRGFTALLTSHGMKLRHLEVEARALSFSSSTLLPNLRTLTLILSLPLSHQLQHEAHPNVERIIIRNLAHLASSIHHGTLLAQLSTFLCRSGFPRLRAIRVMSTEMTASTIMRLFWTRFGDQLMREGVVLEDLLGAHVEGGVRPRVHRTW